MEANAKFHADLGDYDVDDPTLLDAISERGTRALLFTLVAGEESDLLEGRLKVAEAADDHGHEHGVSRLWLLAGSTVAALAAAAVFVATPPSTLA